MKCVRSVKAKSRRLVKEAVRLSKRALGPAEQGRLVLAERFAKYAVVSAERDQCAAARNDLRAARNKLTAAKQAMRRRNPNAVRR